jgi:hypothetical protein
MPDRKQFDGSLSGSFGIGNCANTRTRYDGLRVNLTERRHDILVSPEERHWCSDHAGTQYAEKRNDAFHDVGKLDRNDGIGLQPEAAQLCCEHRDCVVSLRKA